MTNRQRMITGERFQLAIEHRAFDYLSANGIRTIQDDHLQFVLRRRFQNVTEGGEVSVESATDVLDVVNQRVDVSELLRRGSLPLSKEAIYGQTGLIVLGVSHSAIHPARDAVLGTEDRHERDFGSMIKNINRPDALAIDAGMVRDESYTPTAKRTELISLEGVDAS